MFKEHDLKIGRVFRFFDSKSRPQKMKRSIIVGFTEDRTEVATVFINTPKQKTYSSADLMALQFVVEPNDGRRYIKHESHIDCSDLIQRSTPGLLQDLNNKNALEPGDYIGDVNKRDMKEITRLLVEGEVINIFHLGRFGLLANTA